jgi:hypothetical protein
MVCVKANKFVWQDFLAKVHIRPTIMLKLDVDRGPLTILADAALLTKEEIQNEADKCTTLALVISDSESER